MFLHVMGIIMFSILGVWSIASPYSMWLIGESWRSKNPEGPSDLYLKFVRIGGIIFLVIAFIGIIELFTIDY